MLEVLRRIILLKLQIMGVPLLFRQSFSANIITGTASFLTAYSALGAGLSHFLIIIIN